MDRECYRCHRRAGGQVGWQGAKSRYDRGRCLEAWQVMRGGRIRSWASGAEGIQWLDEDKLCVSTWTPSWVQEAAAARPTSLVDARGVCLPKSTDSPASDARMTPTRRRMHEDSQQRVQT